MKKPMMLLSRKKISAYSRKYAVVGGCTTFFFFASCSYLDLIEPLIPDEEGPTEGYFSPTEINRPVSPVYSSSKTATFIDPTATITGAEHILLAEKIYIGPFAELYGKWEGDDHEDARQLLASTATTYGGDDDDDDKEATIIIGAETNIQDNVTIYANIDRDEESEHLIEMLDLKRVEIGERVIMAHGVTIKGPVEIALEGSDIPADPDDDQEVFLSFGAEVDGAILEINTGVSALGRVGPGVRLRSGYIVLPGKNVTTQEEADDPSLGKVRAITEADVDFNEAVLEVNIAFAREYTRLYREKHANVYGINYDPGNTAFNPERDLPELKGKPTQVPEFRNRIIGEVIMDNTLQEINDRMGDRIALRSDEGEPFVMGSIKEMKDDVIFHALEETDLTVGNNVYYGEKVIVHGGGRLPTGSGPGDPEEPTVVGDDVVLMDESVVFRSTIRNGVTIGHKSAVVGSEIGEGQTIPDKTIIINDAVFGTVEW